MLVAFLQHLSTTPKPNLRILAFMIFLWSCNVRHVAHEVISGIASQCEFRLRIGGRQKVLT